MYRVIDNNWSCLWTASAEDIKDEFSNPVGAYDEWRVQSCETGRTVPLLVFLAEL